MTHQFLGLELEEWDIADLHEAIHTSVTQGASHEFFNINAHAVNLCFQDHEFYEILRTANRVFCDGEGVRLAANLRGAKIPGRITYADWLPHFFPFVAQNGWEIFFYGGRPDVLSIFMKKINDNYPDLKVSGAIDGFVSEEEARRAIQRAAPQILMVGLGMPIQEKWIRESREQLGANVYLSAGAAFDFFSGTVPRAPLLMRNWGLEWLFRLAFEPRRLFKRYVIGNPRFVYRVLRNKKPL